MGLWDDRKAMGPFSKLFVQLGVTAALVVATNLRVLTALDHLGLGPVPSYVVTVLWITAITNAFASIFTVTNTAGTATNYLDLGAATNVPAFYYRVRLVP